MKPVFFATSALEDFWDTSTHVVFASEGCKRFSRRHVWGAFSHEVLKHPFSDPSQYEQAYADAMRLYEKTLPLLARELNELHGVSYSERYWRIIIGFWLMHFIFIFYEKYLAARIALDTFPGLCTIVMPEENYVLLRDGVDTSLMSWGEPYNVQLYSRIFRSMGKVFPERRYVHIYPTQSVCSQGSFWKDMVRRIMLRVSFRAPVFVSHIFIRSYKEKIKLFLKSGGKAGFDLEREAVYPDHPRDNRMRERLKVIMHQDEFSRIFSEILPQEIPQCYVEGYKDRIFQAALQYPSCPKVIISAVGFCGDEAFKFWAASCLEKGTFLAGMQHGGNYGLSFIHPAEEHEKAVTDRYYSWGWTDNNKVYPMPATKYLGLPFLRGHGEKEGVLFSSAFFCRYFFRFYDERHYNNDIYSKDQFQFVASLPEEIRKVVRIRIFANDHGWDVKERWKDFDPDIMLEEWQLTFRESMDRCRVHVTDHPSTTLADSLAANKPTIVFWRRDIFKVRPEAEPYLNCLRDAGILYDSPHEAALALARVYDDIEQWWEDPSRQKAVRTFCDRFARTSPSGYDLWGEELKRISGKTVWFS